jgi:hypothetical protein
MRLFYKPSDYVAFEQVLSEGLERYPADLLTYCVMPGKKRCQPPNLTKLR